MQQRKSRFTYDPHTVTLMPGSRSSASLLMVAAIRVISARGIRACSDAPQLDTMPRVVGSVSFLGCASLVHECAAGR